MVLGQLDSHMQRTEAGPLSYTTHTKVNFKRAQDILECEPLRRKRAVSSSILVLAVISGPVSSDKGNKSESEQMGQHQTKKVLHKKGSCQENEKTTY